MLCLRCKNQPTIERRLDLQKYNIQGDILRIDCSTCNNFVAMKMDQKIVNVNNICNEKSLNEWKQIQTNREKLIYYILCQIVYLENDTPDVKKLESPYDIADESDIVVIRWLYALPLTANTNKISID
ncbi:hypothetical protein KM043_005502 [Ampulex compressa]|nr:hypothetical protein KM043_005502 [Ampulex compressa]